MQRPLVVLTGIHASGKSTVANFLSQIGYLSHAELGWALRQDHFYKTPNATMLIGDDLEWFDKSIMAAELKRDHFINSFTELPHCIETWHIGNLAYASVRSPNLYSALKKRVIKQVKIFNPLILHLSITKDTFMIRSTLPDLKDNDLYSFYHMVEDVITRIITQLSLPYYVIDNNKTIDNLYNQLENIFKGIY